MRIRIIILLILFVSTYTTAQKYSYYLSDSLTSSGCKLVDSGDHLNSQFCTEEVGTELIQRTAEQVSEYGFEDGRTFISKTINLNGVPKKVFLEKIVEDSMTLYYYGHKKYKVFFIQKDSTDFIEIPKKNIDKVAFESTLTLLTSDCKVLENAIKMVSYNRTSLKNLLEQYSKCELKPFPHLRYGVMLGGGMTKLIPQKNIIESYIFDFKHQYNPTVLPGLFIDYPILYSNFSLHADFCLSKNGYSSTWNQNEDIYDLVINATSLNLPVLIRYCYPSNKIRPFVNLGIIYSRNLKSSSSSFKTTLFEDFIQVYKLNTTEFERKNNFGYSFGGGIEYQLNYKRSVFFEARYNRFLFNSENSFRDREFQLITSINL